MISFLQCAVKLRNLLCSLDGVTYYVQENVPYVNSTCVIIVDSGEEGEIEHMMHCVNAYHKVVQGKTWIFTYSALRQCSDKTG